MYYRQLEQDENSETPTAEEWFPSILSNYETYVMHAYAIEESTIDQTEFLKDYLKQDLHVRQKGPDSILTPGKN